MIIVAGREDEKKYTRYEMGALEICVHTAGADVTLTDWLSLAVENGEDVKELAQTIAQDAFDAIAPTLTVPDAAAYLGCTEDLLILAIGKGLLDGMQLGDCWYVLATQVQALYHKLHPEATVHSFEEVK